MPNPTLHPFFIFYTITRPEGGDTMDHDDSGHTPRKAELEAGEESTIEPKPQLFRDRQNSTLFEAMILWDFLLFAATLILIK